MACMAAVLSLGACAPAGSAVGDTQDALPQVAHDAVHAADATVGFVGSGDAAADRSVIDALCDDRLKVSYAAASDSPDAAAEGAAARRGVADFVARAVRVVVIRGIDVTDANRGSWTETLTDARNAGVPVVLLNPVHAPDDELLYAATLRSADAADDGGTRMHVTDAVLAVVRDEPHGRTIDIVVP